ncbi:hypothetical protein JB92DRAFT_2879416 [Gautieria morchelliformis]|nr:hypothetical protein JB92DRAFT_2879416 [Gautieria morchelliformis]
MVRNTCGVRRLDRLIYRKSGPQTTTLLRVSPKNLGRCHAVWLPARRLTGQPCHTPLSLITSAFKTLGMSRPQEYAWYRDNGAPAYQANTSCSYDSGGDDYPDGGPNMPTIQPKHSYYNQGDAWTTTDTPPAAKNVASLMAGSRAMQPDPVPDSPSGVTANMRGTRIEDGSAAIAGPEKGETKVLCPEGCMLHGQARTYMRRYTLWKHLRDSCKGRIGDKPRLDDKAIEGLVVKAFPSQGRKSRKRT